MEIGLANGLADQPRAAARIVPSTLPDADSTVMLSRGRAGDVRQRFRLSPLPPWAHCAPADRWRSDTRSRCSALRGSRDQRALAETLRSLTPARASRKTENRSAGCCAPASSGQLAAAPTRPMKVRRFIPVSLAQTAQTLAHRRGQEVITRSDQRRGNVLPG